MFSQTRIWFINNVKAKRRGLLFYGPPCSMTARSITVVYKRGRSQVGSRSVLRRASDEHAVAVSTWSLRLLTAVCLSAHACWLRGSAVVQWIRPCKERRKRLQLPIYYSSSLFLRELTNRCLWPCRKTRTHDDVSQARCVYDCLMLIMLPLQFFNDFFMFTSFIYFCFSF